MDIELTTTEYEALEFVARIESQLGQPTGKYSIVGLPYRITQSLLEKGMLEEIVVKFSSCFWIDGVVATSKGLKALDAPCNAVARICYYQRREARQQLVQSWFSQGI